MINGLTNEVKTSRKVIPDLLSMKTTWVSFRIGPHRKRMTVEFRSLLDAESRVEYFKVSSSLLDQVRVELKSPKLKNRPNSSLRHEPDSGPQPERLLVPKIKKSLISQPEND